MGEGVLLIVGFVGLGLLAALYWSPLVRVSPGPATRRATDPSWN